MTGKNQNPVSLKQITKFYPNKGKKTKIANKKWQYIKLGPDNTCGLCRILLLLILKLTVIFLPSFKHFFRLTKPKETVIVLFKEKPRQHHYRHYTRMTIWDWPLDKMHQLSEHYLLMLTGHKLLFHLQIKLYATNIHSTKRGYCKNGCYSTAHMLGFHTKRDFSRTF